MLRIISFFFFFLECLLYCLSLLFVFIFYRIYFRRHSVNKMFVKCFEFRIDLLEIVYLGLLFLSLWNDLSSFVITF